MRRMQSHTKEKKKNGLICRATFSYEQAAYFHTPSYSWISVPTCKVPNYGYGLIKQIALLDHLIPEFNSHKF